MMKGSFCQPILVVGRKSSGKTTYLEYILKHLKSKRYTVGGFLCLKNVFIHSKDQYYIIDVKSGKSMLLATRNVEVKWPIHMGQYSFNPAAFKFGNDILMESVNCDIILFDEFGPLEKNGAGFFKSFSYLLKNFNGILFIAVRPSLITSLKQIIAHTNLRQKQ